MTDRLESQLFESVLAFARKGDPGHEGIPEWPVSTSLEEHTMVFGSPTELRSNHDVELIPLAQKNLAGSFEKLLERKKA